MRMRYFIFLITLVLLFPMCNTARDSKDFSPEFRKWAPTPPMGWNSWDCYGPTVSEKEVMANADYMAKNLKKYGWEYIVVDIRWYVENDKSGGYNETDPIFVMDEYGRLTPALNRFPSAAGGKGFKPLAEYIHKKGLKFGIHVMRGVPVIAVKNNTPVMGSNARASEIYSPENQCPWLKDMFTIVSGRPGSQEYYNSILQLYASWDVDFVKVDDLSGHQEEIEMVRKAIDNCGRQVVLSISPGGDKPESAGFLKNNVNMWRTSNDFWDNWPQLKNQFPILDRWAGLGDKGAYPDGDMLPLGKIGLRAERGEPRWSNFTRDEQYTLMTLFAIFRSPLMFGGDLPSNDEFTLSLITNREVINVNQNSVNGKQLFRNGDLIAWTADDPEKGDKYLALFNASDRKPVIEDKAIWKSSQMSSNDSIQYTDLDIDLTGSRKLYLVTSSDDISGYGSHNFSWIGPRLTISGKTSDLTKLPWINITSGRPKASVFNDKGKTPVIFTRGVSIIEYDLPEGTSRFSARAALDNRATYDRLRPNNGKFLIFTRDPAGEEPADEAEIKVLFSQLGLTGTHTVTDLWTGEKSGKFTSEFSAVVNRHGAKLFRIQ